MSHLELALMAAQLFSNDGKLDAQELDKMMNAALADHYLSSEEIRVLESVIRKIKPSEVDDAMRAKLEELRKLIDASK